MDEPERDHLRQHIRELEQANRRWKALAIFCVGVLALVMLAGGTTLLSGGLLLSRREAIRARDAENMARMEAEEARMPAERARQAEMEARLQADEAIRAGKR